MHIPAPGAEPDLEAPAPLQKTKQQSCHQELCVLLFLGEHYCSYYMEVGVGSIQGEEKKGPRPHDSFPQGPLSFPSFRDFDSSVNGLFSL